ncbi:type II toxin-antitoxin system PemK/MazF family toxin [Nodosilinea sp. LEGE 07088]|nr:type II toxin-antitoxin system PemK/MazF family toxin [Nodosilinea sp. LEGE 07088]
MSLKPGEVWLADLGLAAKTRPVVIVSRLDPNPPRVLAIYVPLTTQYRGSAYEVALPKLSLWMAYRAHLWLVKRNIFLLTPLFFTISL